MKKWYVYIVSSIFAFIFFGCAHINFHLPSVSVQTNLPLSRNAIVITCPADVGYLKIESRDGLSKSTIIIAEKLRPGEGVTANVPGLFSDQTVTITVYGYDRKGKFIGRRTREFAFYEGGNYYRIVPWDVTRYELERKGWYGY